MENKQYTIDMMNALLMLRETLVTQPKEVGMTIIFGEDYREEEDWVMTMGESSEEELENIVDNYVDKLDELIRETIKRMNEYSNP
jgi:hypothetical protein